LKKKLAALEGKPIKPRGVAIAPNGVPIPQPKKWEISETRKYNQDADGLAGDEFVATEQSAKKTKKEKTTKKKLIEEVKEPSESEDEEMSDVEFGEDEEPTVSSSKLKEEASSARLSSDAETAKKSKKKSIHRMSEKDGKRARRRESGVDDNAVAELAKKAGLSLKRYNRKLERGEIIFDSDGNPTAISKKELKKSKKEAKKAAKVAEKEAGKKRKRTVDDNETEARAEKKKKRKSKA